MRRLMKKIGDNKETQNREEWESGRIQHSSLFSPLMQSTKYSNTAAISPTTRKEKENQCKKETTNNGTHKFLTRLWGKKGKQKDIKILTTNAGAKKHFQNQVPFAVEDRPCRYGNDSESQVLNGLHTDVQRQRTHISVNIAIFIC